MNRRLGRKLVRDVWVPRYLCRSAHGPCKFRGMVVVLGYETDADILARMHHGPLIT